MAHVGVTAPCIELKTPELAKGEAKFQYKIPLQDPMVVEMGLRSQIPSRITS